ncbi:Uncharacterised protein [Starkeya nomas]|uniref:Lar family restriction alleviation protein n=1 Tax=Starkeya nomas TaxID=2666134 RepID=A0A5S9NZL5_9HYPH|nr:Lar family restriction alleviation protein [Starkeya nomas]CAA0096283.1 Uncharacterised protein [Starkeya nomas]
MAEIELKRCPCCYGTAEFVEDFDDHGRFVAVACTRCGMGSGKHYPLMDDARPNAANEWNRRPDLDMTVLVDGVMDLFPGADRQALTCLAQLAEKAVRRG